jgi:hypothetical protein
MKKNRRNWKWVLLAIIVIRAGVALYLTYFIKVTGDILPLMQVDSPHRIGVSEARLCAHTLFYR